MIYIIDITIMCSDIAHEWLRVTREMRRFPFWQLATWWIGDRAPLRRDFEASFDEVSNLDLSLSQEAYNRIVAR
jgi:hypothetical protein